MHSYYRNLQGGSSLKRWLGLGFGMGVGFELAREGLPVVAFLLLLGLLTHPRLTLALLGGIVVASVAWSQRKRFQVDPLERAKREARARWSGGRP